MLTVGLLEDMKQNTRNSENILAVILVYSKECTRYNIRVGICFVSDLVHYTFCGDVYSLSIYDFLSPTAPKSRNFPASTILDAF